MSKEPTEKDYLQYTGSQVPRFLRLFWTVFIVFGLIYLVKYMWPDLLQWLGR